MTLLLQLKIFIIGFSFLGLVLLERLFPYRAINRPYRHLAANIGLWLINSLLASVFILSFTDWLTTLTPPVVMAWRAQHLPQPSWLIDLLIYDFYIYWWHRLNHALPVLWRFHRVHHLDENLDATTAVRFHAGEVLLSSLWRAPLILLLGIPFSSVLLAEILLLCFSLFQHSNLALPSRLEQTLQLLFVTPGWHFMHHEPDRRNTDSHYGNVLTIWDRLFRTRAIGTASPHMKHGLPQLHDLALLYLLMSPFASIKKIKLWMKP